MSDQLIKRVQQLDDPMAIRLLEQFSGRVFEGMETPVSEMVDGVIPEVKNTAFFQHALSLSEAEQSRPLPVQQSAEIARALLLIFAQDPAMAPALGQALDEYQDDQLMVGTILATGVAVSMIIVAATTRLKVKMANVEIVKDALSEGQQKTLFEALPKLLSAIPA
ncbi:hypothetical protein KG088_17670 [Halomonas sp. TRM85114]|uniref:hypothetical protein n=1 Tax=Halomonas jincaotanensis TaxID=2810616 RepID=UPI001BD41204|nr:hypothetical protein [Halomonas jincaotanensis]MBS9405438.1 hypothetical protein [Halomonas jincaotanensis]